MVVLRCPHCGEKIKQGDKFCAKCGTEINNPVIDQVDTYWEDVGIILATIFKLIVLWFLILFCSGVLANMLDIPAQLAFYSSFPLTVLVYALVR